MRTPTADMHRQTQSSSHMRGRSGSSSELRRLPGTRAVEALAVHGACEAAASGPQRLAGLSSTGSSGAGRPSQASLPASRTCPAGSLFLRILYRLRCCTWRHARSHHCPNHGTTDISSQLAKLAHVAGLLHTRFQAQGDQPPAVGHQSPACCLAERPVLPPGPAEL